MLITPRKVAATLLTLCSLLLAGPASAVAVGNGRNHAKHGSHSSRGGKRRERGTRTHGRRSDRSAAAQLRQHTRRLAAVRPSGEAPAEANKQPGQEAAAVVASVLSTPCQNTEITPTTENLPLARAAVLCLVNRVRAEHDVAPLAFNGKLEEAAEGHCAELISADYFAHVSPGGETPVDRIRAAGYIPNSSVGYVIGENLAWGTYTLSTPQAIVAAWVASPGHLANILESQYTETGIGITPAVPSSLGEGNPGATYAQEFGVIIH